MGHAEFTLRDQVDARRISLDEYWMPFTPNREFKHDPRMIVRAEGMYFWNDRGEKLIDASQHLSSLRFDIADNRVGGDAGEIGDVAVNDCLADDRLTAIFI